MDKYKKYEGIKQALETYSVAVGAYKEINYGLQFEVTMKDLRSVVRIYESKKKGVSVDLSQIKHEAIRNILNNIEQNTSNSEGISLSQISDTKQETPYFTDVIENPMIGVDESGKGDYFGPLVVAGVYADEKNKRILMELGAMDSKKLSDKQIKALANQIKSFCEYEILVIGNQSYNKCYDQINNLNKLLAWGHARVIENLLNKVECPYALSDQFGDERFIKSALMEKGQKIILEQRPRAEENIVVAAASILARDAFVTQMDEMSSKYQIPFPKGASNATITIGRKFVATYGKEKLNEVAKLHFKTTQNI